MAQPVGSYIHITGDTTAQTNIPGFPATGGAFIKVVINRAAGAASFMTLKDGTNVIAIIDLNVPGGSVYEYSVQVGGQLSRTISTTNTTIDTTVVIA